MKGTESHAWILFDEAVHVLLRGTVRVHRGEEADKADGKERGQSSIVEQVEQTDLGPAVGPPSKYFSSLGIVEEASTDRHLLAKGFLLLLRHRFGVGEIREFCLFGQKNLSNCEIFRSAAKTHAKNWSAVLLGVTDCRELVHETKLPEEAVFVRARVFIDASVSKTPMRVCVAPPFSTRALVTGYSIYSSKLI